ncbi:MAG TPA: acetyl-CoA carboxylase biotin carboxyl carrier protein [Spirochaetia bacterium]|nr:acetyl-CoA carboxylase biotin carboxyl carrier protein [Spirochaetia bacterium]
MQISEILEIMNLFDKTSLGEFVLKTEGTELALRKFSQTSDHDGARLKSEDVQIQKESRKSVSLAQDADTGPKKKDSNNEIIVSPIVGTFYRSPAPDSPPFVKEGDTVKKGQPLGIIEAMKVMNSLEAEYECKVVSILVGNGTMVECGTPLFEVSRL